MSTTFETDPIPLPQIADATVVETDAKFFGTQSAGAAIAPFEFPIALVKSNVLADALKRANNLNDLANPATARVNLGVVTLHYVTAAPGAGLGAVGDFALRNTGQFYEKTAADTWTERFDLVTATELSAAGYLTQTTGDSRYALLTALSELIDDRVAALLQAGAGITLTYNDATGQLTIASTGTPGSSLTVEEVDGTPTGTVSKIVFPNGTLAIASGVGTYTPTATGGGTGALVGGTLDAFGDSITAGIGATSDPTRYINKIATNTGWTLTNHGVSGTEATDAADLVYAFDPADTKFSTLAFGFNDLINYQGNVNGQSTFSDALKTLVAWLSIPATARLKAQAGSVTYSGTWNNDTRYGTSTLGKSSAGVGATATFSFNGSALLVGYTRLASGTGIFTITIDGGTAITITGANAQASANGRTYAPALAVIQGLTQTDHTAVITVSSGTVALDWFAGVSENLSNYSGPCCFVGNVIRMGSAAFGSPPTQTQINAYIGTYNNLIAAAVRQLQRLGLRVYGANANNRFTTANWFTDNIHPNDAGHLQIAGAFIDTIRQTPGLLLNGGTGGSGGGSTSLHEDDFTGTNGTALAGRTPPVGNAYYKLLTTAADNGQILSNEAAPVSGQFNLAADVGTNEYTLTASFKTAAGGGGGSQIAFTARAGGANSGSGIVIAITNNSVDWYSATGGSFTTLRNDVFSTPATGTVEMVVTSTSVGFSINGGAYSHTQTIGTHAANTAFAFACASASNDRIDNIVVV